MSLLIPTALFYCKTIFIQHFVLGKGKREGDIVTCQAKKIINPHYRLSRKFVQLYQNCARETFGLYHRVERPFLLGFTSFGQIASHPS